MADHLATIAPKETALKEAGRLELQEGDTAQPRASIHALPFELLADAFSLVQASTHSSALVRSLVYITSVCSTWRSAALETASLWANIVYAGGDSPIAESEMDRIKAYLERSKDSSIDLDLYLSLQPDLLERTIVDLVISPRHIARCRSIAISFQTPGRHANPPPGLFPLRGKLNRLQAFHISCEPPVTLLNPDDDWEPPAPALEPIEFFEGGVNAANTPLLRTFHLGGRITPDCVLSNIPLGTLTRFEACIKAYAWPEVVQVLQHCTAITELHIRSRQPKGYPWFEVDHTGIFLSHLRSLHISGWLVPEFRLRIAVPSLEELALTDREPSPSAPLMPPASTHYVLGTPLSDGIHSVTLSPLVFPDLFDILRPHKTIRTLLVFSSKDYSDYATLLHLFQQLYEDPDPVPDMESKSERSNTSRQSWSASGRARMLPALELLSVRSVTQWGFHHLGTELRKTLDARPNLRIAIERDSFGKDLMGDFDKMRALYQGRLVELSRP